MEKCFLLLNLQVKKSTLRTFCETILAEEAGKKGLNNCEEYLVICWYPEKGNRPKYTFIASKNLKTSRQNSTSCGSDFGIGSNTGKAFSSFICVILDFDSIFRFSHFSQVPLKLMAPVKAPFRKKKVKGFVYDAVAIVLLKLFHASRRVPF